MTAYSPRELVRELGGNAKAADFFGVARQTVSSWTRRSGRFPSAEYFEHQAKLNRQGIVAHPGIWFPELRDKVVTKTAAGWRL